MDKKFKAFVICIILKIVIVSQVYGKKTAEQKFFKIFENVTETADTVILKLNENKMLNLAKEILPPNIGLCQPFDDFIITVVKEEYLDNPDTQVGKAVIKTQTLKCTIEEEDTFLKYFLYFRKIKEKPEEFFVMEWACTYDTGKLVYKVKKHVNPPVIKCLPSV